MHSVRSRLVGVALVLFVLFCLVDERTPLEGCAPAPQAGQWVDIRDESALIIWDAESKTEHFIRRASFTTAADDFGFLVPTPTQPDLGEADDGVFETLRNRTAPRHVYSTTTKTVIGFGPLLPERTWPAAVRGEGFTSAAPPTAVDVLEQKRVAGLDAAVLRADDAQALAEWLDKHGYEARPALTEWLKWYVEHKWIITAFKLSKGERESFEAKSVRMTFQTDTPFYPYREPEDMRNPSGQGSRALRVFLLSDQRYEGTLGEAGSWPANTLWANGVTKFGEQLVPQLKLAETDFAKTLQRANYLTEFEDRSFPRFGTDEVYFRPATDQSTKERPPIVQTKIVIRYWPGPWGAVVLAVGIPLMAGVAIWRMRRRQRVA